MDLSGNRLTMILNIFYHQTPICVILIYIVVNSTVKS